MKIPQVCNRYWQCYSQQLDELFYVATLKQDNQNMEGIICNKLDILAEVVHYLEYIINRILNRLAVQDWNICVIWAVVLHHMELNIMLPHFASAAVAALFSIFFNKFLILTLSLFSKSYSLNPSLALSSIFFPSSLRSSNWIA